MTGHDKQPRPAIDIARSPLYPEDIVKKLREIGPDALHYGNDPWELRAADEIDWLRGIIESTLAAGHDDKTATLLLKLTRDRKR